jgi:KaiC/GvpD/RAD55 family RecA-like ATPase
MLNLGTSTEKKYYVEQLTGGARNRRGNISELAGDLSVDFDLANTIMVIDAYHSVFTFDDTFKEHMEKTRSVRGYEGRVYTKMLHWDMDDAASLEGAQRDSVELIDRLFEIGVEEANLRIYFSGNKGFHIFLLNSDLEEVDGNADTNLYVKHVCKELAVGLKSFDESVYDRTRIIRCANSMHGKSDRYKIPISLSELETMSCGDIYKLALRQREWEWEDEYCSIEYIQASLEEYRESDKERGSRRKPSIAGDNLISGISTGFGETQERNNYFTSYAGVLHSKGLSDGFILETIIALNNNSEHPLKLRDLETIVESVSKYRVSEDYTPVESKDFKSMSDNYEDWKKLKRSRVDIDIGFDLISKELYTFDPGKVMYLAARPSIGKTLFGMQALNKISVGLKQKGLFFSLEMTSSAIFYRSAQIVSKTTERDQKTFSDYLYDNDELIQRTMKEWGNIYTVDKSGLSIGKIEAMALKFKEMNGGQLGPIMIDYVGLMEGTGDYQGLSAVARELKNMAKRLNARVIVLSQLSRKAGDGTIEVQLHHLVDSGALEAAADIIIGLWRSSGDQYRIHTKFVKNRDGVANVKSDLIQTGLNYDSVEYDDSNDLPQEQSFQKRSF